MFILLLLGEQFADSFIINSPELMYRLFGDFSLYIGIDERKKRNKGYD